MAKQRRTQRKTRSSTGKAPARVVVTIRSHQGQPKTVARSTELIRVARDWSYILRTRSRWNDSPDLREFFGQRAVDDLKLIGIPRSFIRRLARARHIEVELHDWNAKDAAANAIHEAASELSWEYLLSAATRNEGRTDELLVTRLFRNRAPAEMPPVPKKVLFVMSNPGRIGDDYEFESELQRIGAAVGDAEVVALRTPRLAELKRAVRARSSNYDVIHVAGVDTHQAPLCAPGIYETLEETRPAVWKHVTDTSGRVLDGMIMRKDNVPELPITYVELAEALINREHPPRVVTLNLYHSGARMARELVRRGAHSALGFLDEVDDELAEAFFQEFYWAWSQPDHMGAPQAFVEAWQKMNAGHLYGTAIVIWMGRSVFELFKTTRRATSQPAVVEEPQKAALALLDGKPIGEILQVELAVQDQVNYSLLHNDRDLLTKLTLTKLVREEIADIAVHVELNVGAESYPYRYTLPVLREPQLALAANVKIPLTASLPRSLGERVRSTIYVKVTCGGRTAYEDTTRVTLIPVDEWLDDTNAEPWLPSFVLPRDPAIPEIIKASRRFIIGITDQPDADFSGYQATDTEAEISYQGVDDQVRAIWTALVNEYRLQYINPPPAYSVRTQRLRTPSDILESNSGTCVDLALLLASCMEYIDIFPVVVLHSGHAFVGYWRSEEAYDRFVGIERIPAWVPAVGSRPARSAGMPYVDPYGWRLTRLNYWEIMDYVKAGDLVLLEATYLTRGKSFADAMTEGCATMRLWRDFDSLLDIRLARTADPPVTPLPIINERPRRT